MVSEEDKNVLAINFEEMRGVERSPVKLQNRKQFKTGVKYLEKHTI